MENKLRVLKSLFALMIFLAALAFEGASYERQIWLLLLFAVFLAWSYVRPGYEKRYYWLYMVDIALIYALEYQSRYLVNYLFHSLYVMTILEAGIFLERKTANVVTGVGMVVSLYKFGADLISRPGARTLSELLFNLFALAFLITLLNYGRLQQGEIVGQELKFRITDNGKGGRGAEGFGLNSMRERLEQMGGQLEVTPGQRFTLTGRLPLRRYS